MKKIILFLLISFISLNAQIQIQVGGSISENFNSLGIVAAATLPSNWRVDKNSSAVRTVGTYSAAGTTTNYNAGNNMSSSAGNGIYNFGLGDAASATDRAIGGISSSSATKSLNVYAYFQNSGSSTIKRLDVSYDVYKFRNGSNAAGFTFQLYYSTDGSNWTAAGPNFITSFSPDLDNSSGTVPLDTKKVINQTITGLNIITGGSLYLAWDYSTTSGTTTSNAQALGIDNFVMNNILATDTAAIPNPPVAISATNISTSGFTANWNTSVGATNYFLDVSTSNTFADFVTNYNNKDVGNVISSAVTGLTQKTKYYYRVRAFNSSGTSGNSSTITVTTDSIITAVQFTAIGNAVSKSQGSYNLVLSIANPSSTNPTSCVVSLGFDSSYTNISQMTPFTSAVVTFPAGSSANQTVTMTINNDGVSERSRKAYIRVHSVSGGLNAASKTGSQSYFWLTIMSGTDGSYYNTINTSLTGNDLKAALHDLIKNNIQYPYTDNSSPNAIDVWKMVADADEDPTNPIYVVGIYSGLDILKSNQVLWNREHVWSKSHGNFSTVTGAGTDAHHLRAENANVNTAKSNLDFDNGGTLVPGTTNCYYDSDSWEPRNDIKGDIARMIFYMATRYQGNGTVQSDPNLTIVDQVNTMALGSDYVGYYGKLSTLLQWNLQDPVDAKEMNRNNIIYSYQHNRNPYIDHPEWVQKIWGGPTVAIPAVPVALAATGATSTGFTANWASSSTATGYSLDVATDNGFVNMLSSYNNKDAGNVTSFAVTGLSAGTNYYYRVRAYNAGGSSASSNVISINIPVGIEAGLMPDTYYLFQNYPNPFNPSTLIKFSLKKSSNVKIMLYDVTGREIRELTNQNYSNGTHTIRFDGSDFSNGIYFYRIITGEFTDIKKMVLIK